MRPVVDASFLARALIHTQLIQSAADELRRLAASGEPLLAPVLIRAEFASTVRRLESRGYFSQDEADALLGFAANLPFEFPWDDRWIRRAVDVARVAELSTIYDSIYLVCAESYGLELYTCDSRFARALPPELARGVRLFSL